MRSRRVAWLILVIGAFGAPAPDACAGVTISRVEANRAQFPVEASSFPGDAPAPCRVPSSPEGVGFAFREDEADGNKPVRLRYKLEGVDRDWRDPPAEMCLLVRLFNDKGKIVSGTRLAFRGETPGWRGQVEDARLVPRQLQLTVPERTESIGVYFISNGGPETTGLMVVDGVQLRIERSGSPPLTMALDHGKGTQMDRPLGIPADWGREGDLPDIAQVRWRSKPSRHPVLVLEDSDPERFGVWRSQRRPVSLAPGDRITLEWNMAHTIGRGGRGTAHYAGLAPGNYWFRVAGVQVSGLPAGAEVSLPVVVVLPLYQRPESWLTATIVVGGVLLAVTRLVTRRRLQLRLARMEREHLLERERARIARDIHDDLGATLAQIAMLSEVAREDAGESTPLCRQLSDIFSRARSATRKLDEIVWAINPANDTLEHLAGYLCQFAEDYLKLADIRFRLDAPDAMPHCALTSSQRHHLFLAAKEALHNVVKHAAATEVWLRMEVRDEILCLRIEDDGQGMAGDAPSPPGHGSENMARRMEHIGGRYVRSGQPGRGTTVELTLPLKGRLP